MTRLLIFGAGASRNYSQYSHGIQGLQMPLDADFFQMSKKVLEYDPISMSYPASLDVEHLLEDLNELFIQDEEYKKTFNENWPKNALRLFDDKRLSLENIMSTFYETSVFNDEYYDMFPGTRKNRLSTLIELISFTLLTAQKGPTCDRHYNIAKKLNKDDMIISFNYDTILDNALRKAGKLTDSGYLVEFSKVFDNKTWERPEQTNSEVTLLKLHGSLNWIRCKRCKLNFLLKSIDVKNRFDMFNYLHSVCIRCGTNSVELVLIPPLIGKNYHEFGVDYLWSDTYNNINSNVDEIIIIGYSLPVADVTSTLLFRKINHKLSQNNKIILKVVNPDKNISEHFRKIFNSSKIEQFESIDKFINYM